MAQNADPAALRHAPLALAAAPYRSAQEHLADLMLRQDWLLKRLLARCPVHRAAGLPGFAAITAQDVQRLLDAPLWPDEPGPGAQPIEQALRQLQQRIDARAGQSRLQGIGLPLHELSRRFALGDGEIDLLLSCLAADLDVRYQRVYGLLHDDMGRRLASPAVAIGLHASTAQEQAAARALLGPLAPLRHYRLLELVDDGAATPWLSQPLRVDARVLAFLLGDGAPDARIAHCIVALDSNIDTLPDDSGDEAASRLLQWVDASRAAGARPLLHLHGAGHAGAGRVVASVARGLGLPVLVVDVEALIDSGADIDQTLFLLFREGLFSQAALYFRDIDRLFEPPHAAQRHRVWLRCMAEMGSVVFASGEQAWNWPLPAPPVLLHTAELQPDSALSQLRAWQALAGPALAEDELHHLVSLHPLPVAAIRDVWRTACGLLAAGDGAGKDPGFLQVQRACRAHAGAPASSLARRVEPRHGWADLVLPSGQLEHLAAICSQARHASRVYGAWCFERKLSLGRGLNTLFSGPPGTGKTLAAEVIAADLGIELLKIDLSQIVSKYIGETEKNLRQLFDQAARANAILFFDEADALLGKRTEVKDAHDRYANTETAYLLQKMEEYPGITILATNLRQNMDAAFTRRMRFIVDFPFPEEADRLRIWQTVWPAEVPLDADVDLSALARQFRLSGGSIRNVALSAAFLAAEEGRPVTMLHLLRAARRELQKMGRLVDEQEPRRPA